MTIDRAVKEELWHDKIMDVRANLLLAVLPLSEEKPQLASQLKWEIVNAPLEQFHPQLWRIEIPAERWVKSGNPKYAEYTAQGLQPEDFKVIVR